MLSFIGVRRLRFGLRIWFRFKNSALVFRGNANAPLCACALGCEEVYLKKVNYLDRNVFLTFKKSENVGGDITSPTLSDAPPV